MKFCHFASKIADILDIPKFLHFPTPTDPSGGIHGDRVPSRKCLGHSRDTLDTFTGTQNRFVGVFGKVEFFMNFMLDLQLNHQISFKSPLGGKIMKIRFSKYRLRIVFSTIPRVKLCSWNPLPSSTTVLDHGVTSAG